MDEARAGELLRAERERIERALRELAPSSGDELVHGDDAKSADRGQCSNLGATELESVTVNKYPFTIAATR